MIDRVALYGGSFNPPHVGHLAVIGYVLATTDVDAVWLVPCPEHAFDKALESFEHRVAMCRKALEIFAPGRACISEVEATLPLPARSIDTLEYLRQQHPHARFDLIVGADVLVERHAWKRWEDIERTTRLHIIGRAGAEIPPGFEPSPELVTVSSTQIQRELAAGRTPSHLLPASVLDYIRTYGLYGTAA